MSTPTQKSRYPRPLKATLAFQQSPSIKSQIDSPSLRSDAQERSRVSSSPERLTQLPTTLQTGNKDYSDHNNFLSSRSSTISGHRRSSSLGSLDDVASNGSEENWEYSHKRSNSCSSADKIKVQHQYKDDQQEVHSRCSIEGLNQEVSSVLEGKSLTYMFSHPDGHIAPVYELLGDRSHITVTTPVSVHSSPSISLPPSPFCISDNEFVSSSSNSLLRDSPIVTDSYSNSHQFSPKPAFAHEPPDGAERCTITQDNMYYAENYIPKAPDRSKANIVFQGSVFAPLLPSHNMKTVAIS